MRKKTIYSLLIGILILGAIGYGVYTFSDVPEGGLSTKEGISEDPEAIVDGIHLRTGLKDGPGLQQVINNCTSCHSSKLITQNRMGAEQWHAAIRWMQETQGLWDLGAQQDTIVAYLVREYPPLKKGRRAALGPIEWYDLK